MEFFAKMQISEDFISRQEKFHIKIRVKKTCIFCKNTNPAIMRFSINQDLYPKGTRMFSFFFLCETRNQKRFHFFHQHLDLRKCTIVSHQDPHAK